MAHIKRGEHIIGNQVRVKVAKNKLAPPFRQVEFDLEFGRGINRASELIDLGVHANIIDKAGSWFSFGVCDFFFFYVTTFVSLYISLCYSFSSYSFLFFSLSVHSSFFSELCFNRMVHVPPPSSSLFICFRLSLPYLWTFPFFCVNFLLPCKGRSSGTRKRSGETISRREPSSNLPFSLFLISFLLSCEKSLLLSWFSICQRLYQLFFFFRCKYSFLGCVSSFRRANSIAFPKCQCNDSRQA